MTRTMPEEEKLLMMDEDLKNFYKEAFDDFDWNGNGRIATGVSKALLFIYSCIYYLIFVM